MWYSHTMRTGMLIFVMIAWVAKVMIVTTTLTLITMLMLISFFLFFLCSRPTSGESAYCAGDHVDGLSASPKDVQLCGVARQENRVQEVSGRIEKGRGNYEEIIASVCASSSSCCYCCGCLRGWDSQRCITNNNLCAVADMVSQSQLFVSYSARVFRRVASEYHQYTPWFSIENELHHTNNGLVTRPESVVVYHLPPCVAHAALEREPAGCLRTYHTQIVVFGHGPTLRSVSPSAVGF